IIAIEGTFIDISDKFYLEEKLKESELKYRNITETSLIGLYILQDNVIKYANQRIADIYGYTVDEMLKWKPGEFIKVIHPDYKDLILKQAQKKQAGLDGIIKQYQFQGIKKTGEIIWIEVFSKTEIYKGKPADLMSVIDISEKKTAE
ncbi:hypothetical protein LCGC14_1095990, partial [marine sediment metagenome]